MAGAGYLPSPLLIVQSIRTVEVRCVLWLSEALAAFSQSEGSHLYCRALEGGLAPRGVPGFDRVLVLDTGKIAEMIDPVSSGELSRRDL